jgi:hypothetical protein
VERHRRSRDDGHIVLDLVEEVGKALRWLVREGALHDDVGLGEQNRVGAAGEVRDRPTVETVRDAAGKVRLVVVLPHPDAVDELQLRDERPPLGPLGVEVGDVACAPSILRA